MRGLTTDLAGNDASTVGNQTVSQMALDDLREEAEIALRLALDLIVYLVMMLWLVFKVLAYGSLSLKHTHTLYLSEECTAGVGQERERYKAQLATPCRPCFPCHRRHSPSWCTQAWKDNRFFSAFVDLDQDLSMSWDEVLRLFVCLAVLPPCHAFHPCLSVCLFLSFSVANSHSLAIPCSPPLSLWEETPHVRSCFLSCSCQVMLYVYRNISSIMNSIIVILLVTVAAIRLHEHDGWFTLPSVWDQVASQIQSCSLCCVLSGILVRAQVCLLYAYTPGLSPNGHVTAYVSGVSCLLDS